MFTSDDEILGTVITSMVLMIVLVMIIIIVITRYQNKVRIHLQEKATLKAQFEQEILTSQNEIKEETMKFISRELHDNVVQMLSLVKIQLNNLSEELPASQKIAQSKEYLTSAIGDLRALSKTLNTNNVLHEGLANTIKFELKRIEKASTIQTNFKEQVEQSKLDSNQEIIIFRIFQELIQNILKHAQAKNINVLLEEQEDFFKIEVQDDGIGFDFEEKLKNKGFDSGAGLANMVYRASLLKGNFKVSKSDGGGSTSVLLLPL